MPDERPAHVPLFPILAVNFIGTLGFSLVLPFLVFLVTDWGGNAFIYGLAGATYSAFQLIGAPILGRWSDQVGRRRVLMLSQEYSPFQMFSLETKTPIFPIKYQYLSHK